MTRKAWIEVDAWTSRGAHRKAYRLARKAGTGGFVIELVSNLEGTYLFEVNYV